MIVAVPNNASTEALAKKGSGILSHAVWFQNYSETVGFYINCIDSADNEEFYLPPTTNAAIPTSLVIQNTGNDQTLVNSAWNAFQSSGGSVNLYCGRW